MNTGTDIAALTSGSLGNPALAALASGKAGKLSMDKIEAAAKDFESMFVSQMLEPMFGDSIGTEAFGDDESGEIYKSLMMDEYGKLIVKSGGVGVADYVKRELLRLQEA